MSQHDEAAAAEGALGNQGQTWSSVSKSTAFKKPSPIFDRPMEITVNMLRGLRMVDETVVVYGSGPRLEDGN